MQILVIECNSELTDHLKAAGFSVLRYTHAQVSSLTALLLDHTDICGMVVQDQASLIWSGAHFLAAAKQLSRKGHTVLVGTGRLSSQCAKNPLVSACDTKDQVIPLLKRPVKKGNGGRPGIPFHHQQPPAAPQQQNNAAAVKPLQIPRDKILFVAIVGSQSRIGCTTQAVGLWHYFKALGFDPAIASSAGQIAQIAGAMRGEAIDGGYRIEGIPFVTDTALAYDCYILDIGINANLEEVKKMADLVILVAGSKPWELQNTAAAARAVRGSTHRILLSFTSKENAEKLQPVFAGEIAVAVPWVPDIWAATLPVQLVYDQLLRELLVKLMEAPTPHPEPQVQ